MNGDGAPQIANSTLRYNNRGIEVYNRHGIPQPVVNRCSFYDNSESNYYVAAWGSWNTTALDAKNNWWGTDNPNEIGVTVYDYNDNSSAAVVDFSSFLDAEKGSPVTKASGGETYLIGCTYGNMTLDGEYMVPYYFRIQPGHEVTAMPGTVIRFMPGAPFVITAEGTLTAGDAEGSPVIFTSDQTSPASDTWEGIRFYDNSAGTLDNCVIEYARVGIYMNGDGAPQIANSTLRYNNRGIEVYNRHGIPQPV
ncbi:MAG: hypothetical protein GY734_06890, partial [Herbaspirillum sp.]|nr:hypothetical protein [Herbaspirillum sp.]